MVVLVLYLVGHLASQLRSYMTPQTGLPERGAVWLEHRVRSSRVTMDRIHLPLTHEQSHGLAPRRTRSSRKRRHIEKRECRAARASRHADYRGFDAILGSDRYLPSRDLQVWIRYLKSYVTTRLVTVAIDWCDVLN